jgi:hypothetical protein
MQAVKLPVALHRELKIQAAVEGVAVKDLAYELLHDALAVRLKRREAKR